MKSTSRNSAPSLGEASFELLGVGDRESSCPLLSSTAGMNTDSDLTRGIALPENELDNQVVFVPVSSSEAAFISTEELWLWWRGPEGTPAAALVTGMPNLLRNEETGFLLGFGQVVAARETALLRFDGRFERVLVRDGDAAACVGVSERRPFFAFSELVCLRAGEPPTGDSSSFDEGDL